MGLCSSQDDLSPEEREQRKAERAASRALDKKLGSAHQDDMNISKLLLLGAGESGKSTLFKQMLYIYGQGHDTEQKQTFIHIIYNNVLTSMKTLCEMTSHYTAASAGVQPSVEYVLGLKGSEEIDSEVGAHLKALWADAGVQATYEMRSHYQLTDSAAYFFDKLDELIKPDYLPDEQDILRSRVRTTGIVENQFQVSGSIFKMFDVGGQRNERKKWMHCFENVTAVLFVAALSGYDQVLYEDENTNRMTEALTLFQETTNNRWFRNTPIILFLNKEDLFDEKFPAVPLTKCQEFADYKGGDDPAAAKDYICQEFTKRIDNPDRLFAYPTCATDTKIMTKIFDTVKDIIIQKSLEEVGLGRG